MVTKKKPTSKGSTTVIHVHVPATKEKKPASKPDRSKSSGKVTSMKRRKNA